MREIHVNNIIEITTTAAYENNWIRIQLNLSVLTGAKPELLTPTIKNSSSPLTNVFFFHAKGKQAQNVYAKRRVMVSRAKEINNLRVNIYSDCIFLYFLYYFVFPLKLHETLYIQFFFILIIFFLSCRY